MGFKDICYKPLVEFYWHMHTVFTIQSVFANEELNNSYLHSTALNSVRKITQCACYFQEIKLTVTGDDS
jgi:hypothetical protein